MSTNLFSNVVDYPPLKLGTRGDKVKRLQTLLNAAGAQLTIDGDFGKFTKGALVAFEIQIGNVGDGVADADVWAALEQSSPKTVELPESHSAHVSDLSPIEFDDDGWMHGEGVKVVESARTNKLATPRLEGRDSHVEGHVAHWTDTRGVGAFALAQRIVKLPTPGQHVGSAHCWVDAQGAIVQSVSAEAGSWHAGSDSALRFRREANGAWVPSPSGWFANSWAWGTEMECIGEVRLSSVSAAVAQKYARFIVDTDKLWQGWPFSFGGQYGNPAVCPASEVVVDPIHPTTRGHHAYPTAQVEAMQRVMSALAGRYGIRRTNMEWGHVSIDPKRRTDPGPLWMDKKEGHMKKILDQIYGAP